MILNWEELFIVFEMRADKIEGANRTSAGHMEYNLVASIKFHEDEVLVNEDDFMEECLSRE